jgi:hypothetical protein
MAIEVVGHCADAHVGDADEAVACAYGVS